jgi:putative aldouronate transport system permease protein
MCIVLLFALLCLLPFYYLITVSISDHRLVIPGDIILWPRGFSLDSYRVTLAQRQFFVSFRVSVLRTVFGTALSLVLTTSMAYAISRPYLRGRRFFILFVLFTMLFNGGIIPTYLVVRYTGLLNKLLALIIPNAISTFNLIVMISFFKAIPAEIEESAKLDGANDILIFLRLIIPVSIPVIATITVFVAVQNWNALMDGIIYVNRSELKPLQVYLSDIVMRGQMEDFFQDSADRAIPTITLQAATIFASTLPILVVYPFFQRFFVTGVMLGAVKG